SAIGGSHGRQPLDTIRKSALDTLAHRPPVEECQRTVECHSMRDAASRLPRLYDVVEAQICARQVRLRREQRVGLDGNQLELQAGRARRLAFALGANLEGT